MFKLFIKRPILSGVISVIIVCLGVLSILTLPITQFPDIVPPSVTVTARYTGASADVMSKTVATPLERAINGVPGMTYMTTVCTNDGMSLTTIYFKVGTDPDVAAVNVQNRVTTVLDELPEEVIRAGVITEKEVNSMLMYLNIMSTDSAHTEKFVYNFADINILRELKRIDGVGLVEIMGSRDYAMRVWLNPNRLAAYNMVPQDVTEAIRNQNIEAAPGKTGISSDKLPQQLQYVLQYTGKFSTAEEYGEIVLKALPDGSLLRLKDVATIEFDSEDYNMTSMTDGRPSASIMIKQRPGSNAREVIQNIKTKMAEIKESSFAPGMDYNISYDVSRFLDASIQSVLKTLLEAFILVFIVVYIFLQDFRSTLIPAIAKIKSAKKERNRVQRSASRWSQKDISSCSNSAIFYFLSVSSILMSSSNPFTPSLKFFTPLPIPFISSGIFLPPKSNKTIMAMMIISPVPKFPRNNN